MSSLSGIFNARALQPGRAGSGIFSNPMLNRGPVTQNQGQWNINKATEQFGNRADIEKAIRGQMGAGQSFSGTHQQMANTLDAQAGAQASAAAAAADLGDRQKNVDAIRGSAQMQSDALANWQRLAGSQRQGLTTPVANALAGLGTGMFANFANVARQGFQPAPNVSGSTLSGPMAQGAQFTGPRVGAPNISAQFANVGQISPRTINPGSISAGSYQMRPTSV